MVPAALLKAFEPLDSFEPDERAYWEQYASEAPLVPLRSVILPKRSGINGAIATAVAEREHADVIVRDGRTFVCPHRTRLRILASLLAFHRTIEAEAAPAFFDEGEVERAIEDLDRLRAAHPAWRNHILQSTWEVPLRWFVLFDDGEREIVPFGGGATLRYETQMPKARRRAADALGLLRRELENPTVVGLVADLVRWIDRFHAESIVVLDYATVGRLLDPASLDEDRSCREIWGAIEALGEGDSDRSASLYGMAAERWSRMRALESCN